MAAPLSLKEQRAKEKEKKLNRQAKKVFSSKPLSNLDNKRLFHYLNQVYVCRYIPCDMTKRSVDTFGYRIPVPHHLRDHIFDVSLEKNLHWQVVMIIYCEDDYGNRYRSICSVRSVNAFKSGRGAIVPYLSLAQQESESSVNTKHIYARASIMMPFTQDTANFVTVMRLCQKELKLTDSDLEQIGDTEQLKYTHDTYEVTEHEDIDYALAVAFMDDDERRVVKDKLNG